MSSEPDPEALQQRIDELEATVQKMLPGRRAVLAAGAGAAAGAFGMQRASNVGEASDGTAVGQIGTSSEKVNVVAHDVTSDSVDTDQYLVGQDDRDLSQDGITSVQVPGDFADPQAAADAIPYLGNGEFVVQIGDDFPTVDLWVHGRLDHGKADDGKTEQQVRWNFGDGSGGRHTIKSIHVSGCVGKTSPLFQSPEIVGDDSPHSPETNYPFTVYGSHGVHVRDALWSGTDHNTAAHFYESSGMVRNSDLGSPNNTAVSAKRNCAVVMDELSGSPGNNAAIAEEGSTINIWDNTATGTIPSGNLKVVNGGQIIDYVNDIVHLGSVYYQHIYSGTDTISANSTESVSSGFSVAVPPLGEGWGFNGVAKIDGDPGENYTMGPSNPDIAWQVRWDTSNVEYVAEVVNNLGSSYDVRNSVWVVGRPYNGGDVGQP
jgi:hypothetical protein